MYLSIFYCLFQVLQWCHVSAGVINTGAYISPVPIYKVSQVNLQLHAHTGGTQLLVSYTYSFTVMTDFCTK